jgi:hypothetical protein
VKTRSIRLIELGAILLAAGGGFEVGRAMRRLLVGLVLCGLIVVIVGLVLTALERRRKTEPEEKSL